MSPKIQRHGASYFNFIHVVCKFDEIGCLFLAYFNVHQFLLSFLQVRRDCGGEFEKNKIPMPECSMIYPDDDDPKNKGLCHLTLFPVAWPVKRVEGRNC